MIIIKISGTITVDYGHTFPKIIRTFFWKKSATMRINPFQEWEEINGRTTDFLKWFKCYIRISKEKHRKKEKNLHNPWPNGEKCLFLHHTSADAPFRREQGRQRLGETYIGKAFISALFFDHWNFATFNLSESKATMNAHCWDMVFYDDLLPTGCVFSPWQGWKDVAVGATHRLYKKVMCFGVRILRCSSLTGGQCEGLSGETSGDTDSHVFSFYMPRPKHRKKRNNNATAEIWRVS